MLDANGCELDVITSHRFQINVDKWRKPSMNINAKWDIDGIEWSKRKNDYDG